MADIVKACFPGNILEPTTTKIFEKYIPHAHSGDEQVRIAIVIHISKCRADTHPIRQPYARACGDVLKPAPSNILPKLIAAELAYKVNVQQAIAIDVRDRDARAVVVVDRFIVVPNIINDVALESYLAF